MKAYKIFILSIAATAAVSCEETIDGNYKLHAAFSDHFITCYARTNELSSYIVPIENGAPHIVVKPIATGGLTTEWIYSSDERFAELQEYYGDTHFNDTLYSHLAYQDPYGTPLADPIATVEVTCDSDFDAAHPAGSSLNDCLHFLSSSVKPFIDSGYQTTFDWTGIDERYWYHVYGTPFERKLQKSEHLHPVDKPLTQTTQDDMTLLVGSFYGGYGKAIFLLRFETEPAEKGEYAFTTVVRFADGRELSTTAKYTF